MLNSASANGYLGLKLVICQRYAVFSGLLHNTYTLENYLVPYYDSIKKIANPIKEKPTTPYYYFQNHTTLLHKHTFE